MLFGGRDYLAHANDHVLTWAMIETTEGLENIEAILQVRGLDAIYVGPSDLALSLGRPVIPEIHPEVRTAIVRLLEATKAANKRAGVFCPTTAVGREMAALGFDLITVSNDAEMLRRAASASVEAMRKPLEA